MNSLTAQKTLASDSLYKKIKMYCKNFSFIMFLILSTIGSYTYFLTNYTISIDDFSGDRYYFGQLFAQGRLTSTIVRHLFGLIDNNMWFIDFIGVLLLAFSAIIFCILFDKYIKTENTVPQTIFACLLVTSPIYTEIFTYTGCTLAIGGSFTLVALALWLVQNFCETGKKRNMVISALLIAIVASWYESIIVIYFGAVFSLLILKYIHQNEKANFKDIFFGGLKYAIPLIAGIIAEFIAGTIVMKLVNFPGWTGADNVSRFLTGTADSLINIILRYIANYVLAGLWYLPITIFLIAIAASVILCLYYTIKKKSWWLFALFIGLWLSLFILSLISGSAASYRMSQIVAFFTAFIAFLAVYTVCRTNKKTLKRIVYVICSYLIILQITNTNYWFNVDCMRYEEEKSVIKQVGITLYQNYDINKPVVFVGEFELSDTIKDMTYIKTDNIAYKAFKSVGKEKLFVGPDAKGEYVRKITKSSCNSYINWSINAFGEVNTELLNFFEYQGFSFKQGTRDMFNEAKELSKDMPRWPNKGSIKDNGKYIVVNF